MSSSSALRRPLQTEPVRFFLTIYGSDGDGSLHEVETAETNGELTAHVVGRVAAEQHDGAVVFQERLGRRGRRLEVIKTYGKVPEAAKLPVLAPAIGRGESADLKVPRRRILVVGQNPDDCRQALNWPDCDIVCLPDAESVLDELWVDGDDVVAVALVGGLESRDEAHGDLVAVIDRHWPNIELVPPFAPLKGLDDERRRG